jgi:hypothetical protein
MTLKLLAAALAALAVMLGGFLKSLDTVPQATLGASLPQTFDSANMTSSVVTLTGAGTSSAMFRLGGIIPVGSAIGNVNRKFGQLQNSGSAAAFCVMSSTSTGLSSTSFGFVIQPSSTVNSEWNVQPTGGNMYAGQVFCIAGTATATIAVEEAN